MGYLVPSEHAAVIKKAADNYLGIVEKVAKAAGVRCKSLHVTSDFPSEVILTTAAREKCDLVFIALHGRRSLPRFLLGSQTQKVLAGSKIPVLVHR